MAGTILKSFKRIQKLFKQQDFMKP
jgi:hypothetical protein